jgi:hypothetical protein
MYTGVHQPANQGPMYTRVRIELGLDCDLSFFTLILDTLTDSIEPDRDIMNLLEETTNLRTALESGAVISELLEQRLIEVDQRVNGITALRTVTAFKYVLLLQTRLFALL